MKHDDATGSTVDASRVRIPRAPLLRGAVVDRYLIVDKLGQGGMGVVYKAFDPELGRPIALKLLNTHSDIDDILRGRLLREAQALARVSHPNVIAVHDVGTFDNDVFIAMEFVDGPSLRRWLTSEARSQAEILAVFLAAGEGLSAAHRAGLVHRDFKPDNVIIGRDGRVRVLDFGLARTAIGEEEAAQSAAAAAAAAAAETGDDKARAARRDDEVTADEKPPAHDTAADAAPAKAATDAPAKAATDETAKAATAAPAQAGGEANAPAATMPRSVHSRPTVHASALPPLDDPSLSSAVDRLRTNLTRAGSIMGTPRFMAPEQRQGNAVDERADQFSFCLSLYEALAGQYPFAGDSIDEIDRNVLAGSMRELPPTSRMPRWLQKVLLRGLSTAPDRRYPSMDALIAALRADPSLTRRNRWLALLGAAVALVAVIGWRGAQKREIHACAGAEAKLADIWDAPRRAAIRKTFLDSGATYAPAVFATVDHVFDAYAHAWVAMHIDACEATNVRREQSEELLDLRMSCLEDRRMQLKTLSDLYVAADEKIIERAAQSAESIPGLAACADAAALRAPMQPPRDKPTQARVVALRGQLAQANALYLVARYEQGITVAKDVLADPTTQHYPPLQAEAELRLGRLLGEHGDFPESASALHRAFVAALQGHHDEAAAEAAINLIQAVGERQAHYEDGDRWSAVAEALIGRVQRQDALLGHYYTNRSLLRERESKFDDSLRDATAALEHDTRVEGPADQLNLAPDYHQLGNIHEARGEYPAALEAYQHAYSVERAALGPDHPNLAKTLVGMADVYGESGEHERALAMYDRALVEFRRLQPDNPSLPMVYNNMGEELRALGRTEQALAQYRRALEIWQVKLGPSYETVVALGNIAQGEVDLGRDADALRDFLRGQEVCDQALGPKHAACGANLAGMGKAYRLLGKLDLARDDFARALAILEAAHGAKSAKLVPALLGLGRVDVARHNGAAAIAPLERALVLREAEPDDGSELAEVRLALAEALPATARPRAVTLATQARDAFAKGGPRVAPLLTEATAWLAAHR
ncbi:MAG TPA: tetratricopeptide repeat protein [Polyangia bacterium]|nr:tetratricopeptide repeat protein [Polyangia bacterium]